MCLLKGAIPFKLQLLTASIPFGTLSNKKKRFKNAFKKPFTAGEKAADRWKQAENSSSAFAAAINTKQRILTVFTSKWHKSYRKHWNGFILFLIYSYFIIMPFLQIVANLTQSGKQNTQKEEEMADISNTHKNINQNHLCKPHQKHKWSAGGGEILFTTFKSCCVGSFL